MQPRPDSNGSGMMKPAAANPAANALKHGFCAEKILSPEILARSGVIREELMKIHDPWSDDEIQAVDQIAITRAQQFELERAMRLKIDDEKQRAAELFDRSALDRLAADLARCRENPALFGPILGTTYTGADWLAKLWAGIADDLAPDDSGVYGSLPFSLACEAAMALNSPWQVDRADSEGSWLMARYVRIAPDSDTAMALWVETSKAPDGTEFSLARARRIVAKAPADRSTAAAELVARAKSEHTRWLLRARDLRSNYETALAHAAEAAVGTGSGDPELEKGFRLLSRYLTSARNRADRCERRLDALKRDRKRLAYRKQKDDEREARRLREESRRAMSRFENESNRHEEPRSDFYASPKSPEYADYDMQADNGEQAPDHSHDDFESRDRTSPAQNLTSLVKSCDQSQIIRKAGDAIALRNEMPPVSGIASCSVAKRPAMHAEKEFEQEMRPKSSDEPAWLDGKTPLLERLPMMRYRNWANPAEVFDDEVEVLRRLVSIPPSVDGEQAIRSLFGSPKTLRRCWKAYQAWAGEGGTRVSN